MATTTNWLWGPGGATGLVIAVGLERSRLDGLCGTVQLLTRVRIPHGVDNQEQGAPISLCGDPRGGWPQLWPAVKHYN